MQQSCPGQLVVFQIVKKFPEFYETRNLSTLLRWASWMQSTHHLLFFIRYILVLSFHLRQGPKRGRPICHSVSPPKFYVRLSSSSYVPHARPILFFLFGSLNNIWWGLQIMKLLIMEFSAVSCYLLRLLSNLFWNSSSLCPCTNVETKFHTHTKLQVKL